MSAFPDPLPPEVRASFNRSARSQSVDPWRDYEAAPTQYGCGGVALLLCLIIALTVGFVIYAALTGNRINDLENDVKKLKTQAATPARAPSDTTRRIDAVLQRQDKPPVPQLPAPLPSKPPVAERPMWASELKPRWLQFETPMDDTLMRLPPDGGHKGLAVAEANGYKVECHFGDSVIQSARGQIELVFSTNDETGEEYAVVQVLGPAFRGRACVLEWMAA